MKQAYDRGLVGDGQVWFGSDALAGPALRSHLPAATATDVLRGYFWLSPTTVFRSEARTSDEQIKP